MSNYKNVEGRRWYAYPFHPILPAPFLIGYFHEEDGYLEALLDGDYRHDYADWVAVHYWGGYYVAPD